MHMIGDARGACTCQGWLRQKKNALAAVAGSRNGYGNDAQ
jgi:hypothetical protein